MALVLAANGPYLVGGFRYDPSLLFSGLGVHVSGAVLAGYPVIDPNYGFQSQALGHLAINDWLHGVIPWWNPYEGIGSPLAGNMQSAAFFPLVVLELAPWGLLASHIGLESVAGVAAYLLARELGVSTPGALVTGGAFALDGTFAWLGHAPANEIATLPLVLLGVESARRAARSGQGGGWLLLALAFGLSVYAGFPETAFIDGLLAGVWAIARAPGPDVAAIRRFAVKFLSGAATGATLGAPLLVAFLDDLRGADVGGHGAALATASVPVGGAVQLGFPYYLGPIFGFTSQDRSAGHLLTGVWATTGGYLGTSLVVLALAGVAGRRHRWLKVALAAWVALCASRIFGAGWAVKVVDALPALHRTAFFRYCPASVELALAVLAGLGVDALLKADGRRRLMLVAAVLAATAAAVAAVVVEGAALASKVATDQIGTWQDVSLGWGLAVVAAIGGAAFLRPGWRARIIPAVALVDAAVLFAVPQLSAPRRGSLDTAPIQYLRQHLGFQRVYSLEYSLEPNYGSYFDAAQLDDNDLPVPGLWAQYVSQRLDPAADPLTFIGASTRSVPSPSTTPVAELEGHLAGYRAAAVGYILAPAGLRLPAPLQPVWSDGRATVFRLPGAASFFGASTPRCRVYPSTWSDVRISCPSPALLVRRELYQPGWQATVDGRLVKVTVFDEAFQAVAVPSGLTTVRFDFTPPHMTAGIAAWELGALALAGPWIAGASRARAARRRRDGGAARRHPGGGLSLRGRRGRRARAAR